MVKNDWFEKNRIKAEEIEPIARSICQDYPTDKPLTRKEKKELADKRIFLVETIYQYLRWRPLKQNREEFYGDYAMEIYDLLEDGLKPGKKWNGLFFLNFLDLLKKRIASSKEPNDNDDIKRQHIKGAIDAIAIRHGKSKSEASKLRESFFDKNSILSPNSLRNYLRVKFSFTEDEINDFLDKDFYPVYSNSLDVEYDNEDRVSDADKLSKGLYNPQETEFNNSYNDIVKVVKKAFFMAKNEKEKRKLKYCLTFYMLEALSFNEGVSTSNVPDLALDGMVPFEDLLPFIDKDYLLEHLKDNVDRKKRMEMMAEHLGIRPETCQKAFSAAKTYMIQVASTIHAYSFKVDSRC